MSADAPIALTVAVLAYNEAENLPAAIDEITRELASLGAPWEVLIVDDGSTDGMSALADDLSAADPRLRVVHHGVNRGLGGGYRTAFDEARGTFLIIFPADGQFPADIITTFFRQMDNLDMLLGTLPNRERPPLARAASRVEQLLYRALVGPMPSFQGVLMFRTALLRALPLRSEGRGWAILLEFILRVHRAGYRVRSTPTTLRPRRAGVSKVLNRRTIESNLRQLFALRAALRDGG